MLATMPALLRAPRGDGHPVLVIPGLLAGDLSTPPLRQYLAIPGYNVHPWGLGRNIGGVSRMASAVQLQIAEIRRATNCKVSVIGWSLGGVYARLAAPANPGDVRCVITLGNPFAGTRGGSSLGVNPSVLWAIADRLVFREREFKPFDRTGPFGLGYAI
jgi:pimeloyl-ACP methyl ester carboxylesterase